MLHLPQTTPEQRLPLYEDVESLIMVGFLSHTVMISGVQLALRSLGPGDLFLLKTRVQCPEPSWEVWAIASSIWMVNGIPFIGESQLTPHLAERIRRLPKRAQDILFSLVMGLFARQAKAVDATEAYCYENLSRFRWKSYGNHLASTHSGIPNMEALGSNYVQRMWAFYNETEDQRQRDETYWDGLKLVVSTQSPKGVKKIDQRDKQLMEAEQARRQAVQDKFYYLAQGVLTPEQVEKKENLDVLTLSSKSPEQLEEEMRRWVAGEEDWHDKVVNAYKAKILAQHEAEKAEMERRAVVLRERLAREESQGLKPTTALVGYTQEQMAALLSDRQPGTPGAPGARILYEENRSREFLYQRHLSRRADPGLLDARGGGIAVREQADLTEQVANRAVPFRSDKDEG